MKNMTFKEFKARVQWSMYKRGLTHEMMCDLFGVSENYLQKVLDGKIRDENAKRIIRDLINYF